MNILRHLPTQSHHAFTVWQKIRTNWLITMIHRFIIGLFVLSVGLLLWRFPVLPPQVPLWFSRPWGTDQLASPYWLFLLPASGIVWYAINLLLSIYVTAEYLIFTQILFLSSLIVSLLSFVALVKILFLIS